MKKEKIVALASLSVLATVALVSCSGNAEKKTKPGVFVYASAYEYTMGKKIKATGWRNTECLSYSVKDAENLKYGEQDVEITIIPNKPFFTLKLWQDEDTWEPVGNPFRPYVGLGSPNNKYAYELAENVAWTFEEKSNPDKPYDEKYVITVKKEYFQRNIVISFENEDHPILVHKSDYYENHTAITPDVYASKVEQENLFSSDGYSLLKKEEDMCDFSAPSKGFTITYRSQSQKNDSDDKANYSSELISFDGWDETETFTDEETGKSLTKFKNFEVRGYTGEKDEQDEPIYEVLTEYTKETTDDKKVTVFTQTKRGSQYISFYVPWALVVKDDDNYTTKYENIEIAFTHSIFKMGINTTFENIAYQYQTAGNYVIIRELISDRFANHKFRLSKTDNNTTYLTIWQSSTDSGSNYDFVYKDRQANCNYGASFFANKTAKPKITLTYNANVDDEEVTETINIDASTDPLQTNWRNTAFGAVTPDTSYELEYWENNGWTLVRFANNNNSFNTEFNTEADSPFTGDVYAYYLYPSDEEISYILPSEDLEANSIEIKVM